MTTQSRYYFVLASAALDWLPSLLTTPLLCATLHSISAWDNKGYKHTCMYMLCWLLTQKNRPNEYIKQLKIARVSRDGRMKKYTTRVSRDNNKQDASLHAISWKHCCLKKVVGCILSVLFRPTIPTYSYNL